jgi:hypothetical protein
MNFSVNFSGARNSLKIKLPNHQHSSQSGETAQEREPDDAKSQDHAAHLSGASNARSKAMFRTHPVATVPSDFRRFASPVEHRDLFDIIGRSTGRRIFGGAP